MSSFRDLVPLLTTLSELPHSGHDGGSNLKSSNMVVRVFFFAMSSWMDCGYFNLSPGFGMPQCTLTELTILGGARAFKLPQYVGIFTR